MDETVLLVDDNSKLRDLFRVSLESFGRMRVVGEAADGASGIAEAARLHPDVVLLDLSMPTMDGLEALARIRRASPTSHVVVLTGFKADRLAEVAADLGASAFLEKGLPPTRLADAIRAATARPPPPPREISPASLEAIQERVRDLV